MNALKSPQTPDAQELPSRDLRHASQSQMREHGHKRIAMKFAALLLPAGCLLGGCAGAFILPVPEFSNQSVHGTVIHQRQIDFIVEGQTTRKELTNRLGDHFSASPRWPALAYTWELPGGKAIWSWWAFGTEGGVSKSGDFDWSRWRALFVLWNDHGIVADKALVRLSSRKSLDDQLERWAKHRSQTPERSQSVGQPPGRPTLSPRD